MAALSFIIAIVIVVLSYLFINCMINSIKNNETGNSIFNSILTVFFISFIWVFVYGYFARSPQKICTDFVNNRIEQIVTVTYSSQQDAIIKVDTTYRYSTLDTSKTPNDKNSLLF